MDLFPPSFCALRTGEAARKWLERSFAINRSVIDVFSDPRFDEFRRSKAFAEIYDDPVAKHPQLSQIEHSVRIERGVKIPMRDGVVLLAKLCSSPSTPANVHAISLTRMLDSRSGRLFFSFFFFPLDVEPSMC